MYLRTSIPALGLICLLFVGLAMPHPAEAWFWRRQPVDTSPAVQSEAAAPLYSDALGALSAGNRSKAARIFRRLEKRYPAADVAAESLFQYALIQFENRNWKKAYESFQAILMRHPQFARFNDVLEYQFRVALAMADGEGMRFLWVFPYRALNRATAYFELAVATAPYSDLAPLALMNVALIHQYKDQIPEAIDALDRLINLYPNSVLAPTAYLMLAQTFASLVDGPMYDQGATREALSYFEDFLILYPDSAEVLEAEEGLSSMRDMHARSKLVIGEYYFRYRRWFDAALIFFNQTITLAPESAAADQAREYIQRIEQIRAEARLTPAEEEAQRSFISRFFRRLAA
jgi:outer membrane protein assembly factor BamD